MKKLFVLSLLSLVFNFGFSQSVPFPTGYRDFEAISPWGYTQSGTSWNTSQYLPFIYRDMWYRFKAPNGVTYNSSTRQWTNNDPSKKYPIILFFHGAGERGTDNNRQLIHGGQDHLNAVNSGRFPGFLLYPQNVSGGKAGDLIKKLIQELPIDPNRIYVHGLSNGAKWALDFMLINPELTAAISPMSGVDGRVMDDSTYLFVPTRQAQGGRDTNPDPWYTQQIADWFSERGGNFEYFLFPNLGHGTWNDMYRLPDFFEWFLSKRTNTIHVLFKRNEICPEDPLVATLGVTSGHQAYEWRRNGTLIASGPSKYYIKVAEYGLYTCRIQNKLTGLWTDWSDPVEIKQKSVTNTPPIGVSGLKSIVLPAPDGSTTTALELPTGYADYAWYDASTNQLVGNDRIFNAATVGSYRAIVKETYGCSSNPSPTFNVISANGPNKPDPINGFIGYSLSQTAVRLLWNDNPTPSFNETGFEIYRAPSSTGPFKLIKITLPDANSFDDTNLIAGTTYHYLIRPVNATSAGSTSNIVSVLTELDILAPSAPSNLSLVSNSANSISVRWGASTDNIGVYLYNVYVNGIKALAVSSTTLTATIFGLSQDQTYNVTVKAIDATGNISPSSNQVTAYTSANGLNYKYYEGSWPMLPDFNSLTPIETGNTPNVDLAVRNRNENFAIYWEGTINIPVAGNYTFETYSDDGSKLYIGGYSESNLVVNNDGAHGMQYREGTRFFPTPGNYPIVITYAQVGGGYGMQIFWKNTAHGVTATRQAIPNSAFVKTAALPGSAPLPPTNLSATAISYNQINLTWQDNSNNETGFQIFRSTSNTGTYSVVATVGANSTSYSDMSVNHSTRYFYRIQAIGQYGESGFSNEKARGLNYKYYEAILNDVASIDGLTPVKTGLSPTFDLNVRNRVPNIGFKWEGSIIIPVTGNYTFFTRSDDGSTLYINGALVVSNDFNQSMTERSGRVDNLQAGSKHSIVVYYRNNSNTSLGLEVRYQAGSGTSGSNLTNRLSKRIIPSSSFIEDEINATTLALPPPPIAPTNLVATASDARTINLTWTDNSTTESQFRILRSVDGPGAVSSYKTVAANTTSFLDEGLFPRVTYYYRVDAVNATGGTSSSNVVTITTPNTAPQFTTALQNFSAPFNQETVVSIAATDSDGDALIIGEIDLPAFVQFFDYADGTAEMFINPAQTDEGVYENLKIYVDDGFGGTDTLTFNLGVNSNRNPVITGANPISIKESYITSVTLQANDADNDAVTWEFQNVPDFVTINNQGNTVVLEIAPTLDNAGTYQINIATSDGKGGVDSKVLQITVLDYNPNFTVSVNFGIGSNAGSPWNNFMVASHNFTGFTSQTLGSLISNSNTTTDISVVVDMPWTEARSTGGVTPGLYPNAVMQSFFFHGNSVARTLKIAGLNPNGKYDLRFMSSRNLNDGINRTTRFTIGTQVENLNANLNANTTADFLNLTPDAQGNISVSISRTVNNGFAILNALVITSKYEGNTAPSAPSSLSATINAASNIALNWSDNSFNETGFEVQRGTDGINYTPLATTAADATSFIDVNFVRGTTYHYKVRAVNAAGPSVFTNPVQITSVNRAPVFNAIAPMQVFENDWKWFTISATDGDGDNLSFSLSDGETAVPGFVWIEQIDWTTMNLGVAPVIGDAGNYNFNIVANDGNGGITSTPVSLSVVGPNEVWINFTNTSNIAPQPWNNVTGLTAGTQVNLINVSNEASPFTMRLVNAWNVNSGGVNTNGATGTSFYPNQVTQTSYIIWNTDATTRTIEFNGFDPTKQYEFTFFASRMNVTDTRTARYTIGTKFVSLNASNNSTNLAVLPGIKADATGKITLVVSKEVAGTFVHLNSIVVKEFEDLGLPAVPTNVSALALNRSSIRVGWNDNSDNETGFEVWRSAGTNANYQLITTLPANSNTFTNQNLTSGTPYYYKIRAINANGVSAYSNEIATSTFDFSVSINFHAFNGGPANWNNINTPLINTGMTFNNLFDETSANTGISMSVVAPFTGDNPWGMNTGNNSGVVPDRVMEGSYWIDPGVVAILEFKNLSFLKKYNFSFFGSRNATGNRTTIYRINGVEVSLNSSLNTNQIVQINDVIPAANGTITVEITTAAGAIFGYLNGLIIQAVPNNSGTSAARESIASRDASDNSVISADTQLHEVTTSVHPNPFDNRLNVRFSEPLNGETRVRVISSVGVEVFRSFMNASSLEEVEILLDDWLSSGVYILRIENSEITTINHRLIRK